MDDDIPYVLLTPGPLTTSRTVKQAMLRDLSTWDVDYNDQINDIRRRLVGLATSRPGYTCVLIQGSGTFGIEAAIGSLVPAAGKVLIVNNGAYGKRRCRSQIGYGSLGWRSPGRRPAPIWAGLNRP